jgi:hypothetical protein
MERVEDVTLQSSLLGYIDPGSGSILLQVILAALLGSLTLLHRQVLRLVRAVFRRNPPAGDSPEN